MDILYDLYQEILVDFFQRLKLYMGLSDSNDIILEKLIRIIYSLVSLL